MSEQAGRWRYVGDVERIYMSVPVTVQHGAVIEHAGTPAEDGNWEPTDDDVTHGPDNAPVELDDDEEQDTGTTETPGE